jgi:quercetin dioxygenase-like cupin family protein
MEYASLDRRQDWGFRKEAPVLKRFAFVLLIAWFPGHAWAMDQPEKLNVFGTEIILKSDGKDSGGSIAVAEAFVQPGSGPPKHVHTKEDETFYVLEGTFRLWHGDHTMEVRQGDVAFMPRNVPHTYQNIGGETGRLLVTITPAGFEGFFREASRRKLNPPNDMGEINALAAQYGLSFVGPPPPPLK